MSGDLINVCMINTVFHCIPNTKGCAWECSVLHSQAHIFLNVFLFLKFNFLFLKFNFLIF